MASGSSDSFFNQFGSPHAPPKRTVPGQRPPPPSPPGRRTGSGGSGGAGQPQRKPPPPPPPPKPQPPNAMRAGSSGSTGTAATLRTTRQPQFVSATAAGGGAPAAPAASSYYGGGGGSTAAPSSSSSYYGARSSATTTTTAAAAAAATADEHDEWYSAPSAAAAAPSAPSLTSTGNGSYPAQYQQQSPYAASMQQTATTQFYGGGGSSGSFEGTMDASGGGGGGGGFGGTMQPAAAPRASVFDPSQMTGSMGGSVPMDSLEDEPPLLEELGINLEHIAMKTKAVVVPFRRFSKGTALMEPSVIVEDADLAGPLAFALLLGGLMVMHGKIQFGYIYGFGLFGCLSMTAVLNLMSPVQAVSVWTVTSILGYALLPVDVLAALKLLLMPIGLDVIVRLWAVLTVLWSTTASTRLLELGCGMTDQRYLLAYPIALLYSAFVLITIF